MKLKTVILYIIVVFFSFSKVTTAKNTNINTVLFKTSIISFTLDLPKNWYVHSQQAIESLKTAQQLLLPENKALQKGYQRSKKRTTYILVMKKFIKPKKNEFNPGLVGMFENITFKHNIKIGKDYLIRIKKVYRKVHFSKSISFINEEIIKIGNLIYDTMTIKLIINNKKYYQQFFATIYKQHAIIFFYSYRKKSNESVLKRTLHSMKFIK